MVAATYTGRTVSRFVQPVAQCLFVALGALPAASLACQLLCAPSAGHAHHPATQDHSAAAHEAVIPSPDTPAIGSPSQGCDHTGVAAVAVVSDGTNKLPPPVVVAVSRIALGGSDHTTSVIALAASHSPPGAPSGLLALRI